MRKEFMSFPAIAGYFKREWWHLSGKAAYEYDSLKKEL